MTGGCHFEQVILPKKSSLINPIELLVRESIDYASYVEVDQEWYIKDLKEILQMRKDLIKERLSVIYKNRRLQSSKTFVDYEIHDESELSLVTKGRHYDFSIKRKEGRQEEVSLSIFMKREQDFSLEKFRESIYKKLQRDDVSID